MNNDEKINFDDPLFLVSRSIDGDLSASEQVLLDAALAASVELGLEAKRLRRAAGLIETRRTALLQVDWETHAQLVLAQITEDELEFAGVDGVLQKWAGRGPRHDEREMARSVLARIAPARIHKRSAWNTTLRLGAPLAAAAAVALAVTATWFAPLAKTPMLVVTVVEIGPPEMVASGAFESIVSFAKPAEIPADADEAVSFGYMTLGSSPMGHLEESPL